MAAEFPLRHTGVVHEVLELPILELLATSAADATVCLWDQHTATMTRQLRGHQKAIRHIEFLPFHKMIVTAGADHDAIVWNPLVDKLVTTLTVRLPLVLCIRPVVFHHP